MKFINITKYVLAASVMCSFVACSEFLDLKPISEETTDIAYRDASQIESALTGVYESFQSSDYYVWDNIILQDVRTDNCYAGGDNPEIVAIDLYDITPTNGRVYAWWSNIYNAILKANTVLERVDLVTDVKLTETRRSQIKGEAYFLRALH